MRNLPAQLTDISVGLASGQSPMLVLLQQGGQLKDMFGGIGPAAKALGSSLIGLVNPYTLAAAGAGALLLAWKQGSDEAIAYNRSLILTGSYAGLTAGQLQAMAANVSGVSGTMHEAAAALAEVAGSGKFTASQIQLVGSAAVAVSQMTGEATGKTIKQFQELAEKPVEAILKLNDTQHFLTLSTYEQIKALEDEGRAQDAASLAMQVYSKALNDRRAEVVNNAGLMEQAWHGITGAAKGAWDAMLDVGRQESGQDKFDALARVRERLVSERDKGIKFDLNSGRDINAAINAVTAQMAAMQDARVAAEKAASKKATDAALVQIAADSDREAAQFATNAQKLVAEKLKAKNKADDDYAKAVAAGDMKLAEKIRKNESIILAGIEDKYKDKTPARKTADPFGSLNGLVQGAQVKSNTFGTDGQTSQVTSILAIVDAGAKLIASGQDIATVQAKVAVGVAAVNDLYAKQAAQIKSQNVVALDQYREAVNNKLAADKMQLDNQVARIGMGQQEYERQTQLNKVYQDYARVIENLQKQRA
jgi:phage-related minor tail protein